MIKNHALIRLFLLGGLVMMLFSCKKDFMCTCETKGGVGNFTAEYDLTEMTKKDAADACDANEKSYDAGGTKYTTTCSLKRNLRR